MTPAITLEELLAWNDESSAFWNKHLEANPRSWSCPAASAARPTYRSCPAHLGSRTALGPAHRRPARDGPRRDPRRPAGCALRPAPAEPSEILRGLLPLLRQRLGRDLSRWTSIGCRPMRELSPGARLLGHALFHSQRHWAQLATLVRRPDSPRDSRETCSSALA
jgi:hypothetical protein